MALPVPTSFGGQRLWGPVIHAGHTQVGMSLAPARSPRKSLHHTAPKERQVSLMKFNVIMTRTQMGEVTKHSCG